MTRHIVQLLSHSIEAHDMLKLYHGLGHEAFDIGGYIDPRSPHDDKRPALPEVKFFPELKQAVDDLGTDDNLTAAQHRIPDKVLEWADTIVAHHYLDRLYGDWPRIRDWLRGDSNRRVIWRTVGQSVEGNEATAQPFRREGLEIVRYSPMERNIPNYAGEDALIRFYKDPAEWGGWTGTDARVINITQSLRQRDPYTNWRFWRQVTDRLPSIAIGPGSEVIQGTGGVSYADMKTWLRVGRAYLYTGTQPASYTLGLLEALMTGIPVISIGPAHMNVFPYGPKLFEGHELASGWSDDPGKCELVLRMLLEDPDEARKVSEHQRQRVIAEFGIEPVAADWAAYLR